mmetsp:Transcript_44094/g.133595  ORF Transcript_44094/g.133595 Transcript_44094/m.133595 type:complete len:279 (-) Transcript_44094:132-968(-)
MPPSTSPAQAKASPQLHISSARSAGVQHRLAASAYTPAARESPAIPGVASARRPRRLLNSALCPRPTPKGPDVCRASQYASSAPRTSPEASLVSPASTKSWRPSGQPREPKALRTRCAWSKYLKALAKSALSRAADAIRCSKQAPASVSCAPAPCRRRQASAKVSRASLADPIFHLTSPTCSKSSARPSTSPSTMPDCANSASRRASSTSANASMECPLGCPCAVKARCSAEHRGAAGSVATPRTPTFTSASASPHGTKASPRRETIVARRSSRGIAP